MKSNLIFLLVMFCATANARIITLVSGTNASLTIATNETFSILSAYGDKSSISEFVIAKGGYGFSFSANGFSETLQGRPGLSRVIMAGPAVVRIATEGTFVTVEVLPDSFPPDKTLVLPQGTKARIVMESSTNLVHWAEVSPGAFTNNPVNLFFRLRADPIGPNE
jgi:hypothetical protein